MLSPAITVAMSAQAWLIAQASDEAQPGSLITLLMPFVLIAAVFYFLAIRPQKRRSEALRRFQTELDVGDRVRTAGGILGVVAGIDDDEVTLDVGEVTLRFARGAIVANVGEETE